MALLELTLKRRNLSGTPNQINVRCSFVTAP